MLLLTMISSTDFMKGVRYLWILVAAVERRSVK